MPTKADIKQWLDKQIEMHEEQIKFEILCDGIERCGVNRRKIIHLFTGTQKIADIFGLELKKCEGAFDDDNYSFEYRGYEFVQLGEDSDD